MAVSDADLDGPSERLRRAVVRVGVVPAWVVLSAVALGTAATALGGTTPADVPSLVRYLPFLASLVVFGLPHGATDHLAVARLGGPRPFTAVAALYVLGGATYLAVWLLAPAVGFVSFVLLTWYHWGQGDLYVLLAVGDHLRTRGQRLLAVAVRGGIPMIVPLVAFPEVYRAVVAATVGLFDPSTGRWFAVAFRPEVRLALGGGLAACSLAAVALGWVRGGWSDRGWRVDALETGLLWTYFLAVPPVLAVGLYFCLWHSLRHVVRVVAADERTGGASLARGRVGSALADFGRDALPNTVGALALLAGLAVVAPPDAEPASLLGLYLVLLAVLTLPHALVVTWMDLRQGVWSAS